LSDEWGRFGARSAPAVGVFVPGGTGTRQSAGHDEGAIMTTLGKILVFCVFVAALAMGGLMLYLSARTQNWAQAVKDRDEKMVAFNAMLKQENESRQLLMVENDKLNKLLNAKIVEMNAVKARLDADVGEAQSQEKSGAEKQRTSDMLAKQAQVEVTRLQQEIKFVRELLVKREETINVLQNDVAVARAGEQAAKNDVVTMKNRQENMMERIKEQDRKLADATQQKGQPAAGGAGPKDANYQNPPPVYVKGKIDRVSDADKTLVTITIGSDSGLKKDQTLEVYRLNPKAEYVGRIVIVDADLHHAIGRLLRRPGGGALPAMVPGDEVASSVGR
jgi:hypothetical protein